MLYGKGWYNQYLSAYMNYEKGFLPEVGGINNQPAKFSEIMLLMGNYLHEAHDLKRAIEGKGK